MPVTGWMLLRLGGLAAGVGAFFTMLLLDWPPVEARVWVLFLSAVAWFAGRIGQWADDASRRRQTGGG